MSRLTRIASLAALLFALSAGHGPLSAAGDAAPETVTTDTLGYCRELAMRLDRLMASSSHTPKAANDLSVAGKTMCEHGGVRGGILRLRSAIVLMLHPAAVGTTQVGGTQ